MSAAHIEGLDAFMSRDALIDWCAKRATSLGLPTIPEEDFGELEAALLRHFCASWVMADDIFPAGVVEADRTRYAHLIASPGPEHRVIDPDQQVEFMHAVSGLPRSWCATWCYWDFIEAARAELACSGKVYPDLVALMDGALEHALELCERDAAGAP